MALAHALHMLSEEDYLAAELESPVRHEYVGGQVFAMAGASERHNRIALNAAFALRSQTRGTGCIPFVSDMKLRVDAVNAYYYPDVMLACNTSDNHPLVKTSPCVLIEVLSPSTASTDRREKVLAYRQIPSLQAYLLVETEQRQVDYFLRDAQGQWQAGQLDEMSLLAVTCGPHTLRLGLDDLYEDLLF